MGSDLDERFLEDLNANYPGKWAIVRIEKSLNLTQDMPVVATLNEPQGGRSLARTSPPPSPFLCRLAIPNLTAFTIPRPRR
jgi:hypothetical protein